MSEPWCVVLASREHSQPVLSERDPLAAALRRAAAVTALDRIAAVMAAPADDWRRNSVKDMGIRHLFLQPRHKGTAHEVLLTLLLLENRVAPDAPVLFLPADHLVSDEEAMTNSLLSMSEWIAEEPTPVYLLGAVPQGPHDQLGYIVPWHDTMLMPAGVYEFVERPDVRHARKLINAGGLWNTFIFGGKVASLIKLFLPRFDATIAAFRSALHAEQADVELARVYDRLMSVDFSRDVLAKQTDNLNVLRLLRCGWWPLKAPTLRNPQVSK